MIPASLDVSAPLDHGLSRSIVSVVAKDHDRVDVRLYILCVTAV
jgi:hypothetical protein